MFKSSNENSIIHYEVLKHSQTILFTIESCGIEWWQRIQIENIFHIILIQWWPMFQFLSYHIQTPIGNVVHVLASKVVALVRKCCIGNKINTQWWQIGMWKVGDNNRFTNQSKFINVSASLKCEHDIVKVNNQGDNIFYCSHVW